MGNPTSRGGEFPGGGGGGGGVITFTPDPTLCGKVGSCLLMSGSVQCRILTNWYVLVSYAVKNL